MEDRRCVRGALARGAPIKVVVEDGFDRAIGARACGSFSCRSDLDAPFGGGFEPLRPMGATKPDDAKAGAEALFRMGSGFKDQLAERRCRRSNQARIGADNRL